MKIKCPNCGNEDLLGALFCTECGSQMEDFGMKTAALDESVDMPAPQKLTEADLAPGIKITQSVITLHFLEQDQYLPLIGGEEFTLGRINEGQKVLPDVDLTPYGAYQYGVSRVHAVITSAGGKVSIKDLGSVNGTRINNRKLVPHLAEALHNGDMVAVGKLRFQVIIRN